MLPLLNKLPLGAEVILTPFQIGVSNKNYICKPLQIVERDSIQLIEWEGFQELKEFLKGIDLYPNVTENTAYLMAGTLRVLHSKEQYLEDLPYYAGVILEEEPLEDFSKPSDYLLKGSDTGIFSWGVKPINSQDPTQRHLRYLTKHRWITIPMHEIITKPSEDDLRSFFSIPMTLALPPNIL